jgi:hypothetical protein
VALVKTIKFVDSPSIAMLRRQLATLTAQMDQIVKAEQSFDLNMRPPGCPQAFAAWTEKGVRARRQ